MLINAKLSLKRKLRCSPSSRELFRAPSYINKFNWINSEVIRKSISNFSQVDRFKLKIVQSSPPQVYVCNHDVVEFIQICFRLSVDSLGFEIMMACLGRLDHRARTTCKIYRLLIFINNYSDLSICKSGIHFN